MFDSNLFRGGYDFDLDPGCFQLDEYIGYSTKNVYKIFFESKVEPFLNGADLSQCETGVSKSHVIRVVLEAPRTCFYTSSLLARVCHNLAPQSCRYRWHSYP